MSENITESITNAFKKINDIKWYVGTFVIVTSIIGATNIYMNYSNFSKIESVKEEIRDDLHNITEKIDIRHDQMVYLLQKKVEILETKLVVLFNSQHNILIEIKNMPALNIEKKFSVSTGTCFTPPVKVLSNNNAGVDVENELINECYDSMPLNNVKKSTGMNWFII